MHTDPTPAELRELRHAVDDALARALDRILPRLVGLHPVLAPLADELAAFTASGKRIRPALLLLGYAAGGGRRHSEAMGPALALELLHTCALVHDDVIDRAESRRGRPSVHRRFTDAHRDARHAGDARTYGDAIGILLGDLAFVYADELFLDADVAPPQLLAGFRRFTELREEVMAGQVLDLHAAASRSVGRDLALTVATLKSGRYSVTRPLQVGAALAGADTPLIDALQAFGDPLGRAFQVRDDLLGVFGDPRTTGKSVSSDLVEGKRTLLVAEAAERLDAAERRELLDGLGDAALTEAGAVRLRELIEASGARSAAERYVADAVSEAVTALDGLGVDTDVDAALRAVARYLGARSR